MTGMFIYWVTLIIGIAATFLFIVSRVKKGGVPGLITKAIASLLFIATAGSALTANPGEYRYGLLIIVGLACGMLGDVWLDLKWIYERDRDVYLYAGFYSFFTGHLFFIAAIFMHYRWTALTLALSIVFALIGAAGATLMEKPLKMNYGKFRPTCFIYGFILMMTAASSIVAFASTGETVWITMSIGSVLFLLSDLVLSGMYFGEGKNTSLNVIINHGLYYAAQFVIASSVIFL